MYHYTCLNPVSRMGLDRFSGSYLATDRLEDADVVLVRSASMHELELPDRVVAVARAGAGVNNIPLDEYASRGVVVFNTPGANANAVKELVFAGMLLSARDVVDGINWVKSQVGNTSIAQDTEKQKKQYAGSELQGKNLGIIGLGAIGVQVANTAVHMGMEVYGYDPYISVDAAWNLSRSVRHVNDVNQIFRECDYITLHVPLTDSTKGMINYEALNMMKPTAVLINYARDLLVDEKAVIATLAQNRLHRYVSDFPNTTTAGQRGVILSPHLGASTSESEDNCAKMAVDELKDYLENGNIRNSVNYPSCNMGRCTSECRIAICNQNVKKMISQFTAILSDTNIVNMTNTSRGEYAYTLFDLENTPKADVIEQLRTVEGVLRLRVITQSN